MAMPSRCFNSRAPRGARPEQLVEVLPIPEVSIHAPRVGRDDMFIFYLRQPTGVSIHAPRVGRDARQGAPTGVWSFQFTRPAWGATTYLALLFIIRQVSIHAPRVGRDSIPMVVQPRCKRVSIHAPRVGRDLRRMSLLR